MDRDEGAERRGVSCAMGICEVDPRIAVVGLDSSAIVLGSGAITKWLGGISCLGGI